MRACVSAGRKGIKKGVCAARRRKKVILKKREREKVPGGYLLWILDDDSEAKTDQTVLFPITRIQYPPCIREISFSLFFHGKYKAML